MNETNFEHAIYALLIQVAIALLSGNWWLGAAAASFFFLGREHAQFERRLVVGGAPIAGLNPLAGFQFWRWDLDSKLDLAFPVVATLFAAVAQHFGLSIPLAVLAIVLMFLNVADALLTIHVIDQGGRELNPIMRKIMSWVGVPAALVVTKAAFMTIIYVAFFKLLPDWPYAPYVLAALCGLYGLIVCHNWRQAGWA